MAGVAENKVISKESRVRPLEHNRESGGAVVDSQGQDSYQKWKAQFIAQQRRLLIQV